MKGLLLKDFYLMKTVCRTTILCIVLFAVLSVFSTENLYFFFFPCLIASMLPITLLSYDERDKWTQYAMTLPCSDAELVSGKYVIGLVSIAAAVLLNMLAQVIAGKYPQEELAMLAATMLAVSLIGPAILYPLIFKFGIEKGRLFYYCFIGAASAAIMILTNKGQSIRAGGSVYLLLVIGAVLYGLSWLLSIRFYQNRRK